MSRGRRPDVPISERSHESTLGCWTSAEWTPDPRDPLAAAIERIWYFDGALSNVYERVFPGGTLELIVQFDARYRNAATSTVFPDLAFGGLHLQPMTIEGPGRACRVMGVRMHPAGAYALGGAPLHQITGITIDLRDIARAAGDELADAVHAATGASACINAALGWARRRLARSQRADRAIAWAAATIARESTTRIAALCDASGYSATAFARRFREQIGVTPKRYLRLVRFRRALDLVNSDTASLTAIAARTGYYDHAHFDAEFAAFAGMTPRAFRAANRYPGTPSIAE